VTAVILAAGRGSRLHPYTERCPKPLTELAGMTLLDRQITTLRAAGVSDIVVATGYRGAMLERPGTRRIDNPRWRETNMVETLFCAQSAFGDDVIVSYGDIVYEPRVLAALLQSPHDVSVVVDRNWRALWELRFADPAGDAESLRMDGDGRIVDIGNPVTDLDAVEAQYMGLMRFRGPGVAALEAARASMAAHRRPWQERRPVAKAYMTDLLMEMVLTGNAVHAVPVEGGWLEVDTADDYERYAAMIAEGSIAVFFDPARTPAP